MYVKTLSSALFTHTVEGYVKQPKYLWQLAMCFFYLIFTLTHLVFGFLIFVYSSTNTTIDIALMNHKNTAQQLLNISEDIYKLFYHIVFLEVCRAYQIIPDGLFISKKPCIGKPSDRFLDSWEKELENTGVNLRKVLIEYY